MFWINFGMFLTNTYGKWFEMYSTLRYLPGWIELACNFSPDHLHMCDGNEKIAWAEVFQMPLDICSPLAEGANICSSPKVCFTVMHAPDHSLYTTGWWKHYRLPKSFHCNGHFNFCSRGHSFEIILKPQREGSNEATATEYPLKGPARQSDYTWPHVPALPPHGTMLWESTLSECYWRLKLTKGRLLVFLMDRIRPRTEQNILPRKGRPLKLSSVGEIGVYGAYVSPSTHSTNVA